METRIKAMREGRDLKQYEIAAPIGITQRKYSYLETGTQQWPDELLVRLARHQPPLRMELWQAKPPLLFLSQKMISLSCQQNVSILEKMPYSKKRKNHGGLEYGNQ